MVEAVRVSIERVPSNFRDAIAPMELTLVWCVSSVIQLSLFRRRQMLLRVFAIAALVFGMATTAMAGGAHTTHSVNTFKGPRIKSAIMQGRDTSKDAILPDGTINVDPTVTGSVSPSAVDSSNWTAHRILCDSSPNTAEMTSNTYDSALPSVCP
jgi:hypothetical protein